MGAKDSVLKFESLDSADRLIVDDLIKSSNRNRCNDHKFLSFLDAKFGTLGARIE
ncbi:hypothetical protein ACLOJK_040943 [Asimina triloba]